MIAKDMERKSVFWNMLFSLLLALQSAMMMRVLTRVIGADEAGILSIAYATGYLMYTIGVYGVRDFHATDSQRHFSYDDYRRLRIISCCVMFLCSLLYCIFKGYEGHKSLVIFLICILKLEEAVEDLYHGELQRIGRLDLAGKLGTVRLSLTYVLFIVCILYTQNVVLAISAMLIVSLVILFITRSLLRNFVERNLTNNKVKILLNLFIICFPLFVMLFLSIYINNAPKYAIDTYLSEEDQAYYAIISMPVFTINLLSGIVYRPKLLYMAELWNTGKRSEFIQLIWKQVVNIIMISVMITIMGLLIGLRILEALYGMSLIFLKKEFAILLFGGGIVSIYNFFCACLTIIRRQIFMLGIAIFVMVFSRIISSPFVCLAGLTGASYLYLILMMTQLFIVSLIILFCLHQKNEN